MKLLRPTSSSSLLKQITVELINVRVHQTETLKSTATSSFPAVPGLLCLGLSVTLYCVRIQKTPTKRYSLATCHSPRGTFKTTTNPTLLSPWTLLARHTRNNRVFFPKKNSFSGTGHVAFILLVKELGEIFIQYVNVPPSRAALFTPSCAENIYGYRRITQNFRYTKWCQQP